MEIQEKINELRASLDEIDVSFSEKLCEIERQINEFQKNIKENKIEKEHKRYKCYKKDDQYYFVNEGGEVICTLHNNKNDDYRYRTGNYFKTATEAYCYQQYLLTKQELKDLASRLNETTNIDTYHRFFITFDYAIDKLKQEDSFSITPQGAVCCTDKNFLEIAIKEIGEERLINLVRSGV